MPIRSAVMTGGYERMMVELLPDAAMERGVVLLEVRSKRLDSLLANAPLQMDRSWSRALQGLR